VPTKVLDVSAKPSSSLWAYLKCYSKLLSKMLGSYGLNIVTYTIWQAAFHLWYVLMLPHMMFNKLLCSVKWQRLH